MSKKFIKALQRADSEKLVESAYQQYLTEELENMGAKVESFQTAHKTDGLLDGKFIFENREVLFRLLLEVKFDEEFTKRIARTKVLIQCLYYIKAIEQQGGYIPEVILVGDKNECFTVDSRYILPYLEERVDWSIAASQAANSRDNIHLFNKIEQDNKLHSRLHIHHINENFDLIHVVDEIKAISCKERIKRRITPFNVTRIFEYFTFKVLARKTNGESLYSPREQVDFFLQLILNNENCYPHPKKRTIAMINDKEVRVNPDAFASFLHYYLFDYNPKEKKELTGISDRLIEDSDRRRNADFYTPVAWTSEGHQLLDEDLGNNWREEYMVWDSAWGTGNLTKDYHFKELYASTLFQHDIDAGENYNRNATKFQYDFLNDDVELFEGLRQRVEEERETREQEYKLTESDFYETKLWKIAPGLIQGLLEGKKLLFLINPPYETATNRDESSKKGIAETKINQIMQTDKIGASSQQLYAQFLYRIKSLKSLFKGDIFISIFSPTIWLTGSSAKKLRTSLSEEFGYRKGFLFQASNFADVKGNWGISFLLFESTPKPFDFFKVEIKEMSTHKIEVISTKRLYNLDNGNLLSSWVREDIKSIDTFDVPQMKSAITWNKKQNCGRMANEALGYLVIGGNNVYQNNQMVTILSSAYNTGHGISLVPANFNKAVATFTSRRLITGPYSDWTNDKDEYMIPNTNHPHYQQWENDAIIYSLFNTASNQSSLRQIDYNEQNWDIFNHFFFMSKEEIEQLTLDHHNDEVYADIELHGHKERFVYKEIQTILDGMKRAKNAQEQLKNYPEATDEEKAQWSHESTFIGFSPEALAVYEKACELVKESFVFRNRFAEEKPEFHIQTWDAGWYQIKGLLKEYMKDDLEAFNKLYKALEDQMRPMVYELGFLYE